jgi:hypothetical protein
VRMSVGCHATAAGENSSVAQAAPSPPIPSPHSPAALPFSIRFPP